MPKTTDYNRIEFAVTVDHLLVSSKKVIKQLSFSLELLSSSYVMQ